MKTKTYLKSVQKMMSSRPKPKGFKYCSIEDFLLSNGKQMQAGKFPKGIKRGKMKECYLNSFYLSERAGFSYCEGYAHGFAFPVLHAWCLYKGKVVVPTWKDGKDYFGVVIPIIKVIEVQLRSGHYGVLDTWTIGFPFLTGEITLK